MGRDYRLLFLSCVISMMGDGVWLVVVPWLAIQHGADSAGVAFVVGAEFVGLISCVLIGGMLTDRFSRKLVVGWSHFMTLSCRMSCGPKTSTRQMRWSRCHALWWCVSPHQLSAVFLSRCSRLSPSSR